MYLAAAVLYVLGAFVGAWGASLFLRALASRVEAIAARLAVLRGKRARPPLPAGKRLAGLLAGPVLVALGATVVAFTTGVRDWDKPFESLGVNTTTWTACGLAGAFLGLGALYVAWQYDPARGRRRCPTCWYALEGLMGTICPECGHRLRGDADMRRTRRSGWMAVLAVVLLVGGMCLMRVPAVLRGGWRGVIPTTVLIAGMERLPRTLIAQNSNPFRGVTSGTLADRGQSGAMSPWQQRWMAAKASRLARDGRDARDLELALMLGGYMDIDVSSARVYAITIEGMESNDPDVRNAAIAIAPYIMNGLAQQNPTAAPGVIRLLANPDDRVAIQTAQILTGLGPTSVFAYDEVLRQVKDTEATRQRRSAMMVALSAMASYDTEVMSTFKAMCDGDDPVCREFAIKLSAYVPEDQWDDKLVAWAADPDPAISLAAAWAIICRAAGLQPTDNVIKALKMQGETRAKLVAALRLVIPPGLSLPDAFRTELGAGLTHVLSDPDPATVLAACEIMVTGGITPSPEAVPLLRAIADDPARDPPTREAAKRALGAFR